MTGRPRAVYEYGARCTLMRTCTEYTECSPSRTSPFLFTYDVLRLALSTVRTVLHLRGWTSCLLSAACCFGPVTEHEVSGWIPHGSVCLSKDSLSWIRGDMSNACQDVLTGLFIELGRVQSELEPVRTFSPSSLSKKPPCCCKIPCPSIPHLCVSCL